MNELVFLKKDDVFTDSKIIAEAVCYEHGSITRIIRRHQKRFERLGKIEFMDTVSKNLNGGRPSKIYQLNEPQASFLVTLLENNDKVADFKLELVRQFYEMRKFIAERHTQAWIETRQQGKLTRKAETDTIQKLVEYAREQGSSHPDKLYIVYSKLANKFAGVEKRDMASVMQLNNLSLMEHIILHVIDTGILMEKHYKQIYKDCKARLETLNDIAFLEASA